MSSQKRGGFPRSLRSYAYKWFNVDSVLAILINAPYHLLIFDAITLFVLPLNTHPCVEQPVRPQADKRISFNIVGILTDVEVSHYLAYFKVYAGCGKCQAKCDNRNIIRGS